MSNGIVGSHTLSGADQAAEHDQDRREQAGRDAKQDRNTFGFTRLSPGRQKSIVRALLKLHGEGTRVDEIETYLADMIGGAEDEGFGQAKDLAGLLGDTSLLAAG